MKHLFLFLLTFPLAVFCAEEERIKHYVLNPEQIYTIPVHVTDGVTTVMFPAEIEAIHAANVAMNVIPQGANPAFLLAYNKGSYYFSVRALQKNSEGYINIVYGNKIYILYLKADPEKALSSISFQGGGTSRSGRFGREQLAVSPYLLKSCLDKAKAWDILKTKPGSATDEVEVNTSQHVSQYGNYTATVQKVWRFSKYDILVFYIMLKNKTDKVLYYSPREVALGVADKKCFSALADASGEMPPKSETILFSVVTGTHDGIRKLQTENDWKVLLFASEAKKPEKPL